MQSNFDLGPFLAYFCSRPASTQKPGADLQYSPRAMKSEKLLPEAIPAKAGRGGIPFEQD